MTLPPAYTPKSVLNEIQSDDREFKKRLAAAKKVEG